jgi:hypothetical protein
VLPDPIAKVAFAGAAISRQCSCAAPGVYATVFHSLGSQPDTSIFDSFSLSLNGDKQLAASSMWWTFPMYDLTFMLTFDR